jgi:hypothetical protein
MKFPSWYGIGVGALILLQWAFFLTTNSVPELRTTPWEIGAHMFAELSLALALIVGGIGMLRSMQWGGKILLIALGMAIYSEINSPGYFAQSGQWTLVGMFAVLLFGAALSITVLMKQGE